MNITGGKYNSRKVIAPDSDKVRPTLSKIRESVFNILNSIMDFENSTFLDVFSGSGVISLEAISRGFKKVISIEKDYKTAKIIKQNFSSLGIEPNLIINDAISVLDTIKEKFDVIYIDPPYNQIELYNKTLNKIEEKNLLNIDGIIIVESRIDIKYEVSPRFSLIKEKIYGDTTIKLYM